MKPFIYFLFISTSIILASCKQKEKADYILKDAVVHTMNKQNDIAECIVVKDNKILAVGSSEEILSKFNSDSIVSLKGKFIYPAFTDAHAHFFGLAYYLGECNLYNCHSVNEVLFRLKKFYKENPHKTWIIGRGWDQNLFENKTFPNKESLDSVFTNIPVCLTRVDGHAVWINSKTIQLANISRHSKIPGGEIILNDKNEPSGILIDNATVLAEKHIPKLSQQEIILLLKKADSICQKNYIQYVHEAGLDLWQIRLLDSLTENNTIKTKIYAMALPTSENISYFSKHGFIDKEKFKVKAFKIYADGALGSRGALLKKKYADNNSYGLLLNSSDSLEKLFRILYQHNFQVCTHAIGDSANKMILNLYAKILNTPNDKRWRIEHAQVVDSADLFYFSKYNIIPSVQPTHAISDKNWAIHRLGKERIIYAYTYQSLWKQNHLIALGTDFPVEEVSPFKTFFAAVFRCDYNLKDTTAFQPKESLTRLQTLRGMTIDAAYSAFMEKETGSIAPGKKAEFTILNIDLMNISKEKLSEWIQQQ